MSHLRIEQHGKVATNTKIFFVDGDTETDISSCVTGVDLRMQVGEVVTATITGIVGRALVKDVLSEQVLVDLQRAQRSRVPWLRRLRDVTRFGARAREHVKA